MISPRLVTRSATALAALALFAVGFSATPVFTQAALKAPTVAKQHKIGPGLYEIAVSESTGKVYVAGATAPAAIYVLDAQSLDTTSKIDVSSAAAYGVAINDRTQTLYTSNTRAGSVSAIDIKTGKIVATITDPTTPNAHVFRVLVDEDSNTVYVSVAATPGKVWIIDGKTNTLAGTVEEAGSRTTGLAIDKANRKLFVSSMGTNDISVVDLATKKVVARLPAGGERPTQLAFDAKSGRLFVTNQGTANIGVVDTKSGQLVKAVPTGAGALGIGFNSRDNHIYVANRGTGTVTVIDAATLNVVADLKAGTLPNTVAIDTKTGAVYVTNKARAAGRGRAGAPPAGAADAAGRGAAGAGANATQTTPPPAGAPVPPAVDESGDTVTMIKR